MKFLSQIKKWASCGYPAAVDCEGKKLTYAEMDEKSDAIAVYLHDHVKRQQPVIIRGNKENECLVCMAAALKSGNPYIFVPQWFPMEKLANIIKASGSALVISMSEDLGSEVPAQILFKRDLEDICQIGGAVSPEWETGYNDTACIFFTSGSTGVPKGVLIPLSAIEDMEQWWSRLFYRGISNPRVLNCASYAFTASLQTVYSFMIGFGGCLYAVDRATTADFKKLFRVVLEVRPSYLDCTPSFADLCMQDSRFCGEYLPEMAILSVGGEPLTARIAAAILKRFPGTDLVNGYGATEMTSGPVACVITSEMVARGGSMPIGYAAEGTRAYVVDSNRQPVPRGEQGELVVVSKMVSDGYINDPEKNARVFFRDEDGNKGYYTGDLVRMQDDGLILYDGRVNNMVKIGGYRVEMEEVELRLNQISGVVSSIVVPVYHGSRAVMTSAYVIMDSPDKKGMPEVIRIKKALQQNLPAYMIPQRIQFVREFPKNSNGKTDRKKLIEENKILNEN